MKLSVSEKNIWIFSGCVVAAVVISIVVWQLTKSLTSGGKPRLCSTNADCLPARLC